MSHPDDGAGLEEDPPLDRLYVWTRGRTKASRELDMVTMLVAIPHRLAEPFPDPVYYQILQLVQDARSVAEVAALIDKPLFATKILVADLLDWEVLDARAPTFTEDPRNLPLVRIIRDGIEKFFAEST
jgi:hypothetical protein